MTSSSSDEIIRQQLDFYDRILRETAYPYKIALGKMVQFVSQSIDYYGNVIWNETESGGLPLTSDLSCPVAMSDNSYSSSDHPANNLTVVWTYSKEESLR